MRSPHAEQAWYHHRWPWVLVVMLGSNMVAGIALVVIAVTRGDTLVRDDWYAYGQNINREIDRGAEAARRGLRASLVHSGEEGIVLRLEGSGAEAIEKLDLHMRHAAEKAFDKSIGLRRNAEGVFASPWPIPHAGAWHLRLSPPDETWSLSARISQLKPGSKVTFQARD